MIGFAVEHITLVSSWMDFDEGVENEDQKRSITVRGDFSHPPPEVLSYSS